MITYTLDYDWPLILESEGKLNNNCKLRKLLKFQFLQHQLNELGKENL